MKRNLNVFISSNRKMLRLLLFLCEFDRKGPERSVKPRVDAVGDSASQARLHFSSSVFSRVRLSNLQIHAAYELFSVTGDECRQCSPLITLPPAGYVPKTRRYARVSCHTHTQSCNSPSIFSAFMIVIVGFISTAAVMTIGSMCLNNAASLLFSPKKHTRTSRDSDPSAPRPPFSLLLEIIN